MGVQGFGGLGFWIQVSLEGLLEAIHAHLHGALPLVGLIVPPLALGALCRRACLLRDLLFNSQLAWEFVNFGATYAQTPHKWRQDRTWDDPRRDFGGTG